MVVSNYTFHLYEFALKLWKPLAHVIELFPRSMVVEFGGISQKKDYSITLFPKMSEVFEFCCQKSAKFVAKRICRVLIVPSFTLAAVKSQ